MISRRSLFCGAAFAALITPAAAQLFGQGSRTDFAFLPAAPALATRQIATRSYIPNNQIAQGGSTNQIQTRSRHTMASSYQSGIQCYFPNWWVSTAASGAETPSGAALTIQAWIEYPAGTFTQLKFSGSTSGTIANGALLGSDPAAVTIPTATNFWVQTYVVIASTTTAGIPLSGTNSTTTCVDALGGEQYAFGTAAAPLAGTPLVAPFTNNAVNVNYYPAAIVALTTARAAFLTGDSIGFGAQDTIDSTGNLGILARTIGPVMGYINACIPGDRALWAVANYTQRAALSNFCSNVVCEYGINDVRSFTSATNIMAALQTIYGYFFTRSIFQTTITPNTTSTDSWATEPNQTVINTDPQRVLLNSAIAGQLYPLQGVFDVANVLHGTDPTKWLTNGTANKYTADGLHPQQAGYLLVQSSGAINTAVLK